MSEEFEYVESNDIPFKIASDVYSPISRLIPSGKDRSIEERPLTQAERKWFWDHEEQNLITKEMAFALAADLV